MTSPDPTATFRQEARELLDQLAQALLDLDQRPHDLAQNVPFSLAEEIYPMPPERARGAEANGKYSTNQRNW